MPPPRAGAGERSEENMEGPVSDGLPGVSVPVSGDAGARCDVVSRRRKGRAAGGASTPRPPD